MKVKNYFKNIFIKNLNFFSSAFRLKENQEKKRNLIKIKFTHYGKI
tara:strand:- start:306 stop:443 length:138 start_codon:yes stop_codon:yes gene_type:complete